MLIETKWTLSPITQRAQAAFVDYHAAKVLEAIKTAKATLGSEYSEALSGHFDNLANGYFDLSIYNQVSIKFLQKPDSLKYLVWLLFTLNHPAMIQSQSNKLYEANKPEIDAYILDELKKNAGIKSEKDESKSSAEPCPSQTLAV